MYMYREARRLRPEGAALERRRGEGARADGGGELAQENFYNTHRRRGHRFELIRRGSFPRQIKISHCINLIPLYSLPRLPFGQAFVCGRWDEGQEGRPAFCVITSPRCSRIGQTSGLKLPSALYLEGREKKGFRWNRPPRLSARLANKKLLKPALLRK